MTPIIPAKGKRDILFVGVPEGADEYTLADTAAGQHLFYWQKERHVIELPTGRWAMLPRLSKITEEQAAGLVDAILGCGGKYNAYHLSGTSYVKYGSYLLDTALESLRSLMTSVKAYTVNPFGEKEPPRLVPFYRASGFETDNDRQHLKEWREQCDKWKAAQQTTFPDFAVLVKE